jgi:hypothetical protein
MKKPTALFLLSILTIGLAFFLDNRRFPLFIVASFYILPLVLSIVGLVFGNKQEFGQKSNLGIYGNVFIVILYVLAIMYAIIRNV